MFFSQDPDCPKMWWLVSAVFLWDCSSPGINEPGFDTSSDLFNSLSLSLSSDLP